MSKAIGSGCPQPQQRLPEGEVLPDGGDPVRDPAVTVRGVVGLKASLDGHGVAMTTSDEVATVLRTWWRRIDATDWNGMAELLHPDLRAHYVHTGEVLTAPMLVRVNREYPGRWKATVEDLVASGDRAVSRTRVTDGVDTFHVASFATVRAGTIVELVEVWTNGVTEVPEDRRPG